MADEVNPNVVPTVNPTVSPVANQNLSPTISKWDWFLFVILTSLPVINIVAIIVYACISSKPSRANLAKVMIIIFLISVVLCGVFFGLCASALNNLMK